jgi:hypothetical protein
VLQGVTPVAITLPEYERAVYPRRELVTRDRPFRVSLLYVTNWAIAPLVGAWLIAVAALVWSFRREIESLRERLRARIALNDPPAAG